MARNGTENKVLKRLTPGQQNAIAGLLTHHNVDEAAQSCGISKRTLFRWLQDPGFLHEYRSAQKAVMDEATSKLMAATGQAIEVLRKNLTCGDPRVEINAASTLLSHTLKYERLEFIDRIQRLELKAFGKVQTHKPDLW